MQNPVYDFAMENGISYEVVIQTLCRNMDSFIESLKSKGMANDEVGAIRNFITLTDWFTNEPKLNAIKTVVGKQMYEELRKG